MIATTIQSGRETRFTDAAATPALYGEGASAGTDGDGYEKQLRESLV